MSFKELTKTRESCRSYMQKEIASEDIRDILETARLSPSACNSQPWKFIVCNGETAGNLPACIINSLIPINKWTSEVPVFIVVCETKAKLMESLPVTSQHYAQIDLGLAVSTLCYAASDKGLSTCIIGAFSEKKVKELLSIPKNINVRLIIALGYAKNDTVREKKRKAYDEIVCINQWQD